MKEITLGHYNPNKVTHNEIHMAVLATRPHATMTKSKKGKLEQMERRAKQNGWCY